MNQGLSGPRLPEVIVLVRHVECDKNVQHMIGVAGQAEELTPCGSSQGDVLGKACAQAKHWLGSFELLCADSDRARYTAKAIERIAAPSRTVQLPLRSLEIGEADGLTEEQLSTLFPATFEDLSLYRAGVLNSYMMRLPKGAEDQRQFETRTVAVFNSAIERVDTKWAVCVLHRSPITTLCIHIARVCGVYPAEFFGYVDINPGAAYILLSDNGVLRVKRANIQPERLGQELMATVHRAAPNTIV